MSAKDERVWQYLTDTTNQVPGVVIPADSPTPYWRETILSEAGADEVYYSVIAAYASKALHRVYTADGKGSQLDLSSRYTHYYDFYRLPSAVDLESKLNAAVNRCSQQWWDSEARPVLSPQVLGYEERCHFQTHCDNSLLTSEGWVRNDPLRDLTGLLYLSDCVPVPTKPNQHSGGELTFDNIGTGEAPFTVLPKKGMFLVFPSHPMHCHRVSTVVRGYRLAIVNWWTLC